MPTDHDIQQKRKLIAEIQETIKRDDELRKKFDIGEKFRFVRDRLHKLVDHLEKTMPVAIAKSKMKTDAAEDEISVYVYLYNAQGLQFRTWQNLVNPKVFYEYSVNRPIYGDKQHIYNLLRSKTNKAQHAYLTVVVKKEKILQTQGEQKDSLGSPLIKVREGSLHYDNVICFTHNDHDYILNDSGELLKKT